MLILMISFYVLNLLNVVLNGHSFHGLLPNLTNTNTDYCSVKCQGEDHTMCKFKDRSPQCVRFVITYEPKKGVNLLNMINTARNRMGDTQTTNYFPGLPDASNMRLMMWDKELASIAHRWLSQCIVGHDKCRDTMKDEVGQTIGFYAEVNLKENRDDTYNLASTLEVWLNEVENVTTSDITSFRTENTRIHNFSQIFWAQTYKMGCSEVEYGMPNHRMVATACNYAPQGNIPGQPIYKVGKGCTACPEETHCGFHGFELLCGREEDINKDEDFALIVDFSGCHIVSTSFAPLLTFLLRGI